MNFQECIREVMIQTMLREQPDVETVSVTTADPLFVLHINPGISPFHSIPKFGH